MKTLAGLSIPVLLLFATLGVLLGSGAYTMYYAEGASYLSDDPRTCVNCHIMREHYDGWQKASHHAAATCNDCHLPHDFVGRYVVKSENGYNHSRAFTLQDFHEPIRIHSRNAQVVQDKCVHCHEAMVSQIVATTADPADRLRCVHCHDSVGHGPTK